MADIDIVQPVEGAARVSFDYTAASDALDALSAMGRKLGEQSEARVVPKDEVVVNWVGYYHDEFSRAWGLLQSRFTAAIEGAGWAGLQIYEAIGDANEMQRSLNTAAQSPPAETNPSPGAHGGGHPI